MSELRTVALCLTFFLLAGCHSSLPPIEGRYVTSDGQTTLLKDGAFVGAMLGQGSYIVEGTHVTMRLSQGPRLEGERLDDAHFQINRRDGQPIRPADFYREGSPGAEDGKRALAARMGDPVPTDAERDAQAAAQRSAEAAAAFTPDPSLPLQRYAPLDTAEDAAMVEAAFAAPPLTDEQLLAALVPGYSAQADAFKRRDLAAALPAIKAKVEQAKGQHYYSVRVSTGDMTQAMRIVASLGSYDLNQHAFPIIAGAAGCFRQIDNSIFRTAPPTFPCVFPLTDESLARKIEAARARSIYLGLEGRVYYAVTGAAPFHQGVPAVPLHAELKAVDSNDPSVHAEATL